MLRQRGPGGCPHPRAPPPRRPRPVRATSYGGELDASILPCSLYRGGLRGRRVRHRLRAPARRPVAPKARARRPASPAAGSPGASASAASGYDPASVSGTVVFSGWQASPEEGAALETVLANFAEAYPNITVDYQPVAGDYPAAMTAKFSSGEPPDLFYVDSSVAPEWIDEDVLVDLEPLAAERGFDTSAFFPGYLDAFRGPEGGIYGFPKDGNTLAHGLQHRDARGGRHRAADELGGAAGRRRGADERRHEGVLPQPLARPGARVHLPERWLAAERRQEPEHVRLAGDARRAAARTSAGSRTARRPARPTSATTGAASPSARARSR